MGGFFSRSKRLDRGSSSRSSNKSVSKKDKEKKRRSTVAGAIETAEYNAKPEQRTSAVSVNRRRSFGGGLFKSSSGRGSVLTNRASEIPVRKKFVVEEEKIRNVNKENNNRPNADSGNVAAILQKKAQIQNKTNNVNHSNSLNDEWNSYTPLKPLADNSMDKVKRKSFSSSKLSLNSKRDKATISSLDSYEMPKDYFSVSSSRLNHISNLQGMKEELRSSIQNVIESMQPAEVKSVPINRESLFYSSHHGNVRRRSWNKHSMRPVSNIYDSVNLNNATFSSGSEKLAPSKSTEAVHRKQSHEKLKLEDTQRNSKYYESDDVAYAVVNINDIKDVKMEESFQNENRRLSSLKMDKNKNNEKMYANFKFDSSAENTQTKDDIRKPSVQKDTVLVDERHFDDEDLYENVYFEPTEDIINVGAVSAPNSNFNNVTKPIEYLQQNNLEIKDITRKQSTVDKTVKPEEKTRNEEDSDIINDNNNWMSNDIYSEDSLDELSDTTDDGDEESSWTYKDFNTKFANQSGRSRVPIVYEEDSDSSVEYVGVLDEFGIRKKPGSVKKCQLKRNKGNMEKPLKWATREQAEIYNRDCQPNGPTAPYSGYIIPRVKPVYSSKKHRRDEQHYQQYPGDNNDEQDDWSSERGMERAEHGSVKDKAKLYEKKGLIMAPGEQIRVKERIVGSSPPLHSQYRIPDSRAHQLLEFRANAGYDGSRPLRVKSMGPLKTERLALGTKDILHCGNVRVVKKAENGVKIPKQWHDNFLILKADKLEFYESEKAWRDQHLHRFDIVLKNGLVDLENVKKRIKIVDANNDMYVTEHVNEREAKEWMTLIRNNALVIASASQPSPMASPSPTLARHRTKSASKAASDESVNNIPSTGDSQENIPKNNKTTSKILDKWLRKRPQKDTLITKGIYQDEAVFGRNLWEVCPPERPRIPEFVVRCVKVIEGNVQNMTTDGIYRASGNLSQIQKLRLDVNQKNYSVVNDTVDVHVLTGVLKLFFRELKEPLIPFEFFQKAINASCFQDTDSRIKQFKEIVRSLPVCNKDTLTFFLEHLLKVTKYEDQNRMKVSNLAIIFGPTILWAPPNVNQNLALDFLKQNEVIEYLLNNYKLIFQGEIFDGREQKKFETKM